MTFGRLTPLQTRLLEVLSGLRPQWVLGGGAALAAVHTKHRPTRDLDLFWPRIAVLGEIADSTERCIKQACLSAEWIQREPSFARLRVSEGEEVVVLDLVAEPREFLVAATQLMIGKAQILVENPHEILVDKLCSLLGRSEIRDLEDVRVLLEAGGELERALRDAPRKDAGFSPLTLAWVLRGMDVAALADLSAWDPDSVTRLIPFRDSLVRRITDLAEPR